ncbi:MAG: hypothetical protein ACK56F_21680, partial [bacterium]
PYKKLKELLLESYGMTDEQRTNKWIDYPMCGSETRPSVLWDNLTALQPASLNKAQAALFIRKLPRHISAMINTKSFDTPQEMVRRCNQLWGWRPRPPRRPPPPPPQPRPLPAHGNTLLFGTPRPADPPPRTATRRPAATRPATNQTAATAHPPPGQPRAVATTACVSTTPASAARPTSARGAAPTRKTNRPAAGPLIF